MIEKEWYDWFRDPYAVDETMVMQKQFENRIYSTYNRFPGVADAVENDVIMPLSRGEITPAAGVEAVTPKVEAIIKDTLGK